MRNNLCTYFSLPSAMSCDTSATAAENIVSYFKIYSLIRPLRIKCERKNQSDNASPSALYRRLICTCKYFTLQWCLMAKNTTVFLLNYGRNLNFHSLLDVDNNVIYGLCRRYMLLQFSKIQFLCYACDTLFWGEAVGISRISKRPIAINRLRTRTLTEYRVNTSECKRTWTSE